MTMHVWTRFLVLAIAVFSVMAVTSRAEPVSGPEAPAFNDEAPCQVTYTVTFSPDDLSFGTLLGYDVVTLKDSITTHAIAEPLLPAVNITVALPPEIAVTRVTALESQAIELPERYDILPAQIPRTTNQLRLQVPFVEPDPVTYASTEPYPGHLVAFDHQTDLAGQSMVRILVYPLQYTPATKTLTFHTSITLSIEGRTGYTCGDYLPRNASMRQQDTYERMIGGMVINPSDVQLRVSPLPQPTGVDPLLEYDYVIIVPSTSWETAFQPLADWRAKAGIPSTIVTTDWIYSQPEYTGSNQDKIQMFVEDAHANWGATFFLLGGDTGYIPYKTKYYYLEFSSGWEHIYAPSDSYYGDYDQDFTCEVHVGRASVTNTTAINTFINKVFTYEKNPPVTNYAKKAALLGFDLDGYTDAEDCKIYIDNNYIPATWTMSNVYDSHGGSHEANAKAAINAGQNLINHADHGSTYYMGIGDYNHWTGLTTSEVDAFYNGDKQSILYSLSCDLAAFDAGNCIAEHFTRDSNGGCVAFIGNSRYGIFIQGSTSTYSFLYDREFFEAIFQEGHYILGEAFSDHKNEGSVSNGYYQLIFDELNILGDPRLSIWTDDPSGLNVTHDSYVCIGSATFDVHVEEDGGPDVNQAFVCLWKGDDVYMTDYTDVNGDVTFNIDTASMGTMYVTVTAHNYLPYEGESDVIVCGGPPGPVIADDYEKLRYISFTPGGPELSSAFRVTISSCPLFPEAVGIEKWIGPVDEYGASYLQCEPYYQIITSTIDVGDKDIVPEATYTVEATYNGVEFSGAVDISTSLVWGDIVGSCAGGTCTPPDGNVNLADVMAVIGRYQGDPDAPPLSWCDLMTETPDRTVGLADILAVIAGFQSGEYPNSAPEGC